MDKTLAEAQPAKKDGKTVANADLWPRTDRLSSQYELHWLNAKGKQDEYQGLEEAAKLAAGAVKELA